MMYVCIENPAAAPRQIKKGTEEEVLVKNQYGNARGKKKTNLITAFVSLIAPLLCPFFNS